ncbi:MAG: radical SAM protein [Bacteroidia bacterium]|nr:MAG: radical SAM protein [Bacteroidia bacterium]
MPFLFSETIFGPVRSRRLGISLGVNLLPTSSKFCNFNCVYCECGWTAKGGVPRLPARQEVAHMLESKLREMHTAGESLDVITFAGNGEPTIHPQFPEVIDDTLRIRDLYYPGARVVVLSNATMLGHPGVMDALRRVDQAALKLDSAIDHTMLAMDKPLQPLSVEKIVARLLDFGHEYTLQTMFLRGEHEGQRIDNTQPEEVEAWLSVVERLRPRDVMVYTIDRATPAEGLQKVPIAELEDIGRRVEALGISVQVRG